MKTGGFPFDQVTSRGEVIALEVFELGEERVEAENFGNQFAVLFIPARIDLAVRGMLHKFIAPKGSDDFVPTALARASIPLGLCLYFHLCDFLFEAFEVVTGDRDACFDATGVSRRRDKGPRVVAMPRRRGKQFGVLAGKRFCNRSADRGAQHCRRACRLGKGSLFGFRDFLLS